MREIKTTVIEINLTRLMGLTGNMIQDSPIELELIPLYKYRHTEDSNTYTLFTNIVLEKLYGSVKNYTLSDIYTFIPKKRYEHCFLNFVHTLEIFILNKIRPNPLDIVFLKYKVFTKESIIAIFRVDFLKENYNDALPIATDSVCAG